MFRKKVLSIMSLNVFPTLRVKIAETPEAMAQGLMFVKSMPHDAGMLFIFGRTQKLNFWGENTYLPLDIAFADDKGKVVKIDRINPLSRQTVSSVEPCRYAVEANVGYFEANRIQVGDIMIFNKANGVVAFAKKGSRESSLVLKSAQVITDETIKQFPTLGEYYDHLDSLPPQQPEQNPQEDPNLPVLNPDELGQYLEDSMEEQEQMQDQEGLPQEEPAVPEELEPKNVEELEQQIPQFTNISDAFSWGQENKQVMKINYQTTPKTKGTMLFGNTMITRYVEPHGRYTSHPDGEPSHEILVTFDETVGGIRAFRMQNVKEFSFVGRDFQPKFRVR
jgi:uncharacterized membrane protein (UPF0127 family)